MELQQEVLRFWFPEDYQECDLETNKARATYWFRGGADGDIVTRFSKVTQDAAQGLYDDWQQTAQGRLALILVLDQFSRSVFRDSPQAYAQDPKALELTLTGLANGHYEALSSVWEKTFFLLPINHTEGSDLVERVENHLHFTDKLVEEAPEHLKPLFAFSAQQPREHLKVLRVFGRHPHRNAILGRTSTPEEEAYLAEGKLPHMRELKL